MAEKDFIDALSDVQLDEVSVDPAGRIVINNSAAAARVSNMVQAEPMLPEVTVSSVNVMCRPGR
ncbi:hypothetical protein OG250_23685 [Streptomyces sp. NBC_00487]|uniref:hypothetical protein n=1 Tax=unclassified Streptomyces TaxID=2593676 RepID=UPI002DD7CC04|nr:MULTISPECIES: hypothetical protein [unclassified Streptomyces]WRY97590.1 hypothetical protein OG889_24470 [Streptomyces sp. NBC_00481]